MKSFTRKFSLLSTTVAIALGSTFVSMPKANAAVSTTIYRAADGTGVIYQCNLVGWNYTSFTYDCYQINVA